MQESTFTNYDQLPLFLNANTVAQVLGVSIDKDESKWRKE